jgi:hypothetical protein
MGLRARRNIVVWSSSRASGGRGGLATLRRPARTGRLHRFLRTSGLLTVIGLLRLARALRFRWRPVLAGGTLTAAGLILRGGAGGLAFLPGILFLYSALLIEVSPETDRKRRRTLERELASYSTPAQRRDLEATLDQYPDSATNELRDILARQATGTDGNASPGRGRPPFTVRE